MSSLNVAALLAGEPGALELWTLRALAGACSQLTVIQADAPKVRSRLRRARAMMRKQGLGKTLSRAAGSLLAARVEAADRAVLDELFDVDELRAWWKASGMSATRVRGLNEPDALRALDDAAADVFVRVSGGVLRRPVLARARLAALNLHHGLAPAIRGIWSIPWGIIEGRADWIGATIHVMDEGIDTGPVLWRGAPQLAPGDTSADILFRAHLEAVAALVKILGEYAAGRAPRPWPVPRAERSVYRSGAGLGDVLKFLRLGRGTRAEVLLERGIE